MTWPVPRARKPLDESAMQENPGIVLFHLSTQIGEIVRQFRSSAGAAAGAISRGAAAAAAATRTTTALRAAAGLATPCLGDCRLAPQVENRE